LDERKSGTSDEAAEAETLSRAAARGTGLVFQQQPPPRRRIGAGGRGIGLAVAAAADAIVARQPGMLRAFVPASSLSRTGKLIQTSEFSSTRLLLGRDGLRASHNWAV